MTDGTDTRKISKEERPQGQNRLTQAYETSYQCKDCLKSFSDYELWGLSVGDECPHCGSTDLVHLTEEGDQTYE